MKYYNNINFKSTEEINEMRWALKKLGLCIIVLVVSSCVTSVFREERYLGPSIHLRKQNASGHD